MSTRTRLQSEANEMDLQIFRLISRLSNFEHKTNNRSAAVIRKSIQALRLARVDVRSLMSEEDRELTNG